MSQQLPPGLRELFPAGDTTARTLPVALPPGRTVRGDEGDDDKPAMWVSDKPASAELWRLLRAGHQQSGLYPLLLDTLSGDARRPWDDGELWPADMSSPETHDPGDLLAGWWNACTDDDDLPSAPFGKQWPGLAPGRRLSIDPDEHAGRCVEDLVRAKPHLRLGLVAASRASDTLAVAGWMGAVNHTNDTAEVSAVLRSWEDRFGARVISAGFAELYLSVAAAPADHAEALRVAAEHFAFCPDNVWQGISPLTAYADRLIDAPQWSFWWD